MPHSIAQPSRLSRMPYHVYTRIGPGALGVIVKTASEALAKAADFLEDGHAEVVFKDLLGSAIERAVLVDIAESECG